MPLLLYSQSEVNLITPEKSSLSGDIELRLSNDEKLLFSYTIHSEKSDNDIKVFDVETGQLIYSLPHVQAVRSIILSNDDRFISFSSNQINIWDIQTGLLIYSISSHSNRYRDTELPHNGILGVKLIDMKLN
mgnify:CR=1 FL=1